MAMQAALESPVGPPNSRTRAELMLCALAIRRPEALGRYEEELGRLAFADIDLDRLRQELLVLHATHPNIESEALQAELQRRGFDGALARVLGDPPPGSSPAPDETDESEAVHAGWRAHLAVLRRSALKQELASAAAVELSAESWERRRQLIRAAMPADDDDS